MTESPMLASPSTGAGNRAPVSFEQLMSTGDWVGDVKIDGIRAFAFYDGDAAVRLVNRNAVDITRKFPELQPPTRWAFGREPLWLDGEIVCDSGSFEQTLTRDKQETTRAISALAEQHPASFVAFDLPALAQRPFTERRAQLELVGRMFGGTRYGVTVTSREVDFLQATRSLGLEGVIVKRAASRYQFGKRSRDWVKFKNLHRVSCLVAGYAPGTGSRSDFGAMMLALVGEHGDIVSCGRVGTGFRGDEIADLKARLDAAEVLVVEIECLNVTPGGQLRFPVYKGVRTDLSPLDCTVAQLRALPSC